MRRCGLRVLGALVGLAACAPPFEHPDLLPPDLSVVIRQPTATDRDADGLEDAEEARLAQAYLPYLSLDPNDACPTSGLVVRVTPGERAGQVRLRYAWIFDRSCGPVPAEGGGGSYSVVVDPAVAAPAGVISIRAIARRDTSCQRISTCGACAGQSRCEALGPQGMPAVWASSGTHALYADRPLSCTQINNCAARCVDAAQPTVPTMVNVGEPGLPLVRDLTDEGFIRTDLGWVSPSLMHYDPWGGLAFGSTVPLDKLLAGSIDDPPSCALAP